MSDAAFPQEEVRSSRATRSARNATAANADPGRGRGPDWLDDFLDRRLPELIAIRRDIHAHPELSRAERRTTAVLAATLEGAGLPAHILPTGTGVTSDLGTGSGTGGSLIALRADIDALPLREAADLPFRSLTPGVAHACGHDIHQTVVLGAGLALAGVPELAGRIRLLFQPAEELMPGGARDLIAAGAMNGVEQIFAVHCEPKVPAGQVGLRVGPITSTADQIEISVSGPGGHTSRPHLTADVVNALGLLITGLPLLLSRRLDPRAAAVLAWGSVHAGEAPNAIPQEGTLRGTLRLMRREAWEGAEAIVADIVAGLLAPTGVGYELHFQRGVPPVDNDPYATALLRAGALAGLGPDSVVDSEQSTGAEDFADLLEHAPGALARLGVWDGVSEQCDLHSARFTADERSIAVGIRLLVHTVLAARQSA
ncbi:MAG: amidohydrolase [Nakamurella sp.]